MTTKLMALVAAVLMASPALAAGVDRRQTRQQARIDHGVASGELTSKEAARLERQSGRVERELERDRADGAGLTASERAKIQRHENQLSRQIYRSKHDRQSR